MGPISNNNAVPVVPRRDEAPPRSGAPTAPTADRRRPWRTALAVGGAALLTAGALAACSPGSNQTDTNPASPNQTSPNQTGTTQPGGKGTLPAAAAPSSDVIGTGSRGGSGGRPSTGPSVQPSANASVQQPATTAGGMANGRYTNTSAGVSFAVPDGWTVEETMVGSPDAPRRTLVVFNEARMQVAELYHGKAAGVGGGCGAGPYPMTELDSAPLTAKMPASASNVRFSYRVLDMRADGGAFDYQAGLVDEVSGQIRNSCPMYSFVAGAPHGTLSFADRASQSSNHDDPIFNSMAEARAYLQTPEYRKLKAMILSLEMQA